MKTNSKTLMAVGAAALALSVVAVSGAAFAQQPITKHVRHATQTTGPTYPVEHWYGNPDRQFGGPNSQMND